MPSMLSPSGEVTSLPDVIVQGARLNFFTFESGGGHGGGGLGTGDAVIEELGEPPVDPDGFMPQPQSCEDIAFLLQDYSQRRDSYDTIRGVIESFGDVKDTLDILEDILAVSGIIGLTGVVARWEAAKAAFEAAKSRFIARIGMASTIGLGIYATMWLATRGTQGRWDSRIKALRSVAEDWNCETD